MVLLSSFGLAGSSFAPEGPGQLPAQWRLKLPSAQGLRLPAGSDPVLQAAPPGLPNALLHPYFKRADFAVKESLFQRYAGHQKDETGLDFFSGPGLSSVDPLCRASPMLPEGPISLTSSPYLSDPCLPPFSSDLSYKKFASGLDEPIDGGLGDIGALLADASREFDMGLHLSAPISKLPNAFDNYMPNTIDLSESMAFQMLRDETDEALQHPEDVTKFLLDTQGGRRLGPGDGTQMDTLLARAEGPEVFTAKSGFEAERYQAHLEFSANPAEMHFDRARGMQMDAMACGADPRTDATLNPVITGGVSIGFRCSDGVVIAADTMLSQGSFQRFHDMRRLHKVNDQIVIAVDGEYADFQEIQTICQDLVAEHDQLEPYGFWKVVPKQAFNVLSTIMYHKRMDQDPLWNTVLVAGYGHDCGPTVAPCSEQDLVDKPFLGQVDMHGTRLEGHIMASGMGVYLALPLMRFATEEAERMRDGHFPKTLTMEEACGWACDVMRVLSLRTSSCSNRIQLATVGVDGVGMSAPFNVEGEWNHQDFHAHEVGSYHERGEEGPTDLWPY